MRGIKGPFALDRLLICGLLFTPVLLYRSPISWIKVKVGPLLPFKSSFQWCTRMNSPHWFYLYFPGLCFGICTGTSAESQR
jgi:hypothetical protein